MEIVSQRIAASREAAALRLSCDYPKLYKKLLADRNEQWVKTLTKWLNDGEDVFVVVGAAHLVGKESVVQLLKDKGFKVEQF